MLFFVDEDEDKIDDLFKMTYLKLRRPGWSIMSSDLYIGKSCLLC